jgi:hypothetical protein
VLHRDHGDLVAARPSMQQLVAIEPAGAVDDGLASD